MPPSPSPSTPSLSQTPTTFHPWSRLPDELKLQILSHLLVHDYVIPAYKRIITPDYPDEVFLHFYQPKPHLFPFIQTRNYKLATLAQEVYYTQNTFSIRIAPHLAHICPWPRAGCMAARFMRRLHVYTRLDVNCTLDELVGGDMGRWLFRIRRDDDDAGVGTSSDEGPSKAGFEKLDLLDVKITLFDEEEDDLYFPIVLTQKTVGRLTELMAEVELGFGAKEVKVSAGSVAIGGEESYNGICGSLGERAVRRSVS